MADSSIEPVRWVLSAQISEILGWFETRESVQWSEVCCRRHGLPTDMAGDVHSESWVKVRSSLSRRVEAFPHLHDQESAHRYAARSMQRTSIDVSRTTRRIESKTYVMDDQHLDPKVLEHMSQVDDSVTLDRWRRAVINHARHDLSCSGCPSDVVFASALKLLAMLQIGDQGSISDLMYEALQEVDDDFPHEKSDAARQRKSRCTRCVLNLLRDAAESAGVL